ncbi:hypothetical protein KAW80_00530 [Candidatus Babeliales bacterium]|nr:hypothetical protein [Candidatus Babeliales bacterium]
MNKFTAFTLLFSSFFHIKVLLANGPEDIVERTNYVNQLSKLLNAQCKDRFALDKEKLTDFEAKKEQYVQQGNPSIFRKEFISFLDSILGTFKVRGEIFYSRTFSPDRPSSKDDPKIKRWKSHLASLLQVHSEVASLMDILGLERETLRNYEENIMAALDLDTPGEVDKIRNCEGESGRIPLPEERIVVGNRILGTLQNLNIVKRDQDLQRSLRRAFRSYMEVINGEDIQEFSTLLDNILRTLEHGVITSYELYHDFQIDDNLRLLINNYSDLLNLLSLFKRFNIKPENFKSEFLRELDRKTRSELSRFLPAVINT